MLRSLVGVGYAPVFFLGFVGAAIHFADRPGTPWVFAALLGLALACTFAIERGAPYEREWNRPRDDARRDFAHLSVNETLTAVSVASLPVLSRFVPSIVSWPVSWPTWLQLVLAVGIADLGITLTHWASHRVGVLWRLHAVHHSVQRLYGLNGLMKHPLHQLLETMAGTSPLLLMGLPLDVAMLLGFTVAIQLLLQHANVDMRLGVLGPIWAVAPAHRHHHVASATEGDVNFGLFTLTWDHLLGTYKAAEGGSHRPELGIEGRPDYPRAYGDQLIEPFRSSRAS